MKSIFYPKLFSVLKEGYTKDLFIKDLFAGVLVGIVALPLAIAIGVASGVTPTQGIITAIIAGFLISMLGGSRYQIGGPTGAFVVIVYSIIQNYGIDGLIISTIIAGVFLVLFGFLKLGALLKFIPHPLIVGFTSGIAVVIFSTQIKDALGLQINSIPSNFIEKWGVFLEHISTTNYYSLVITIITIFIIQYSKKITGKIPGSFIALILMSVLVQIFNIPVNTIGDLFSDISGNISVVFPDIRISELGHYLSPALTIALLGGIESLLSAVVADGMTGSNHRSNTELIAQGIANIVTPFFGGIPATGAIARTATN
ncbi:MAG: SulP family inorganic anion transporter, partial [Bacteroidales bacterium]